MQLPRGPLNDMVLAYAMASWLHYIFEKGNFVVLVLLPFAVAAVLRAVLWLIPEDLSELGDAALTAYRRIGTAASLLVGLYVIVSFAAVIALLWQVRGEAVGQPLPLLRDGWLYGGIPLSLWVMIAQLRRLQRESRDNDTLCDVFRNNATIAALLKSATENVAPRIEQLYHRNMVAVQRFSRQNRLSLILPPWVKPVDAVILFVPHDSAFKIEFVECADPDLKEFIEGLVGENHSPPQVDVRKLAALAKSTHDELQTKVEHSRDSEECHAKFERERRELISMVGIAWAEHRLRFENSRSKLVYLGYLDKVPMERRHELTLRSLVCIPVRHDGSLYGVVMLCSNRYFTFRPETIRYYEKFGHAIGTTIWLRASFQKAGFTAQPYRKFQTLVQAREFLSKFDRFSRAPRKISPPIASPELIRALESPGRLHA